MARVGGQNQSDFRHLGHNAHFLSDESHLKLKENAAHNYIFATNQALDCVAPVIRRNISWVYWTLLAIVSIVIFLLLMYRKRVYLPQFWMSANELLTEVLTRRDGLSKQCDEIQVVEKDGVIELNTVFISDPERPSTCRPVAKWNDLNHISENDIPRTPTHGYVEHKY